MEEESEDEEDDRELCLTELLGGITFDVEWKEEEVPVAEEEESVDQKVSSITQSKVSREWASDRLPVLIVTTTDSGNDADRTRRIYRFAYHCTPDGRVEAPPLRVVDLGPTKGNTLVVTRAIAAGTVLYTERAAAATQEGSGCRACGYCFSSIESADRLSKDLPFASDLWPVPPLRFGQGGRDNDTPAGESKVGHQLDSDEFGRLQCSGCGTLFCTKHHHVAYEQEYGPCCKMAEIVRALEALEADSSVVQAPVALAAKLFPHALQHYRTHQGSLEDHFLDGICGEEEDLPPLELGIQSRSGDGGIAYTLAPLYDSLVSILRVSSTEQEVLSLGFLHKLAAQSGRNGFGLSTQSPFKAYYAGLLRKSMGQRESEEHQANLRKVARALGRTNIERGMDREIDALVAPRICGIFPLTARCNHSCQPNAEVRSQAFVDHHIDVVATRDLVSGEELSISYIGIGPFVGKKSTTQRRRELRARYLFDCDCPRCSGLGTAS